MKIIGINNEMFISSAALLVDGEVVAAAAEERFTREKLSRKFPTKAIEYCLKQAGLKIEEIDYFANAWNPGVYFQKFNPVFSNQRRSHAEQLYSVPDHLMKMFPSEQRNVEYIKQELGLMGKTCTVYYITHHRAHAANAFFQSPFEKSIVLTADAQGEFESTTWGIGEGHQYRHEGEILYPHSIGALYSTFTEYLGFRANSDEWKVMALGAYSHWDNPYYKLFRERVFSAIADGKYELNLSYFNGYLHEQPNLFSQKVVEDFGPSRKRADELTERHYEIAAALQKVTEDVLTEMLCSLYEKYKIPNISVSGGCFMNSVFNGKILKNTPFKSCYISSCPDDSGNSIGAALYLNHQILGEKNRFELKHNYLGPEFSNAEIESTLNKFGISFERIDDIEAYTAQRLVEGNLIGWFQGRMEFGQRALGNRSILADPRRADFKDKVNHAIKYREGFRPFAPAILEECVEEYFDIEPGDSVPFMEKVYHIREEQRGKLGAVCHADGTGRLQTVSKLTNPRFHALIKHFRRATDVPVLLNTSFNLNGEPVVCTPEDAIRTFNSCGLDLLVLGNFVVRKG